MSARFEPGPAWGFVGGTLVALVAADASPALVEHLAGLTVEQAIPTGRVIEVLSGVGIASLPSLAVLLSDSDGYHVLVRGTMRVGVVNGGEVEWIGAPHAASWSEEVRVEASAFLLDLRAGESSRATGSYWCERGVVSASHISVDAQHFPVMTVPVATALTADESPGQRHDTAESPLATVATHAGDAPEVRERNADVELTTSYYSQLIERTQTREPLTPPEPAVIPDVPEVSELADVPAVADVADVVDERAPAEAVTHTLNFEDLNAAPAAGVVTEPHREDEPDAPEPFEAAPGLISSVPSTSGSSSAPTEAVAPDAAALSGDHDGHTVSVDTLRAVNEARQRSAVGTTVQAVHCPAIHPNPPHAAHCRTCGAPINDHTITVITRPVLGELQFENGDSYPVDRPMLIGRKPGTARDSVALGETHRLVTLPDPQQVLSKVHLEIRIEDWHVMAIDRKSTNHTIVTLPDHAPTQLRPGDPMQIVHGTVIDLGGAARARFEIGA